MNVAEAYEKGELLVERHSELVKRIAYHLLGRLPPSVQVEDLIQSGMLGLLEAARMFDPGQGASFETYAGIRIRGAMLDELRRSDWAPRSAHRHAREISAAVRKVEHRQGREATAAEVAGELGIPLEAYHDMLRKVTEAKVFSLEDMLGPDGDVMEVLGHCDDEPSRQCLRQGFAAAVTETLSTLSEREQLVLSLYYDDELNLKEIGEVLGVTESRVCQIHGQALVRLRARLKEWSYEEVAP